MSDLENWGLVPEIEAIFKKVDEDLAKIDFKDEDVLDREMEVVEEYVNKELDVLRNSGFDEEFLEEQVDTGMFYLIGKYYVAGL